MTTDASPPQPTTIQKLATPVYPSFAMLAGMQLDVFTPLKDGPMTAEKLADALNVQAEKLSPLLYALVEAELLTIGNDTFVNTPEANHYLVKGRPTYMGSNHELYTDVWFATFHTAASIRTGVPQAKHDFATMPTEELAAFLRGHHPAAQATGRQLVDRYDFSSHRRLVDVGGGSGGVAIAITAACPHIQATVIELPAVVPVTKGFIDEAEANDRVQVQAVDLLTEPLQGPFDVAVLRNFLQVFSSADACQALRHIHHGLKPDGELYVFGTVLDDSRLTPVEMVRSNLIFPNVLDDGQAYTEQTYRKWFTETNFVGFERVVLPTGFSIIRVHKPR